MSAYHLVAEGKGCFAFFLIYVSMFLKPFRVRVLTFIVRKNTYLNTHTPDCPHFANERMGSQRLRRSWRYQI